MELKFKKLKECKNDQCIYYIKKIQQLNKKIELYNKKVKEEMEKEKNQVLKQQLDIEMADNQPKEETIHKS